MGAFGDLLRVRWGGTIHDVSTWQKPKIPTDKEVEEDKKERDDYLLEAIKQSSENALSRFEEVYKRLDDPKAILESLHTDLSRDKFMDWRDEFLKSLDNK